MTSGSARYIPVQAHARRSFGAAAATYDRAATLQGMVCGELLRRLDALDVQPKRIVDLGCGTGSGSVTLAERHPRADVLAVDFAEPMTRAARSRGQIALTADAAALPLREDSVDLVFSSLALQWSPDPGRTMREIRRVLRPGGLLLFTTLGPRTLHELRSAWAQVDDAPHVHEFLPSEAVERALSAGGLACSELIVSPVTMTYAELSGLTDHLRGLGAVNADRGRNRGLMGRGKLRRLHAAYETFRRADGQLPATFEVLHGMAYKPAATGAGGRLIGTAR